MSADSPASGLPPEAVDAAAQGLFDEFDWPVQPDPAHTDSAEFYGRTRRYAAAALTAALPFLREQWSQQEFRLAQEIVNLRLRQSTAESQLARHIDALAAERAKVAALREATIRECIDALRAGDAVEWALGTRDYGVELLLALLPDAQADDRA